jgi:quinol monooxygenase YgiN
MSELITLINLAFAEGSPNDPAHNREAWTGIIGATKAVPGLTGLYIGQQVEQSSRWTVLARWSAPTDLDAFVKSPAYQPWIDSIAALTAVQPLLVGSFVSGNVTASVEAPATEIIVAFGAQDGFSGPFANLAPVIEGKAFAGYKGSALGETDVPALDYIPHPGKGGVALIGWESVEAHVTAVKGDSDSKGMLHPANPYPSCLCITIDANFLHLSRRRRCCRQGPLQVLRCCPRQLQQGLGWTRVCNGDEENTLCESITTCIEIDCVALRA